MGNAQLSLFSFQNQNQKQYSQQISNFDRKPTFNPQKQSFIRIASCNQKQSDFILENISCYQKNKCQSLSKLKEYYHAKNNKINVYCSNQEFFYIVFQGCACCSLKEQFNFRRINFKSFTELEIKNIIQTFLCAVRQYFQVFGRDLGKIQLEDISFNSRGRLYMKDPWLRKLREAISVNQVNILLQYPSPERLQSSTQLQQSFFDQFLSILFSIGVIGLQLTQMNFVDDLYLNHPKKFNFQKMKQLMKGLPPSQLKSGIQILLNIYPENRRNIYNFWGTSCKKQRYLQKIECRNHEGLLVKNGNNMHKQTIDPDFIFCKNNRIIQQSQPINAYKIPKDYRPTERDLNSNRLNYPQSNFYPIRFEQSVVTKQIQCIRQRPNIQNTSYQINNIQTTPYQRNNNQTTPYQINNELYNHRQYPYRSHSLNPQQRFYTTPNKTNYIQTNIIGQNQNKHQNQYQVYKKQVKNIESAKKNNQFSSYPQQKHQYYNPQQKSHYISYQPWIKDIKNQNHASNNFSNVVANKLRNDISFKQSNNNDDNDTRNLTFAQHKAYGHHKLQQTNKTIPYDYRFKQSNQQTINLRKQTQINNFNRQQEFNYLKKRPELSNLRRQGQLNSYGI